MINCVLTADCIDAFQHANNTAYVNWCQQAAVAHANHLGLSMQRFAELGQALVIRRAEYDYLLPAQLGDALRMQTTVADTDAKLRVQRQFSLYRCRDQQLLFSGVWHSVCIDQTSGRVAPMVAELQKIYANVSD